MNGWGRTLILERSASCALAGVVNAPHCLFFAAARVSLRVPTLGNGMDPTRQGSLFYERIEDALDAIINACGGRKKFACEMWPDKPARDAHNLIDACLNIERRERFSPQQVLFILRRGREVGFNAAAESLFRDIGYHLEPIEPEDEKAALQRAYIESVNVQRRIVERMERLTDRGASIRAA